MRSVKFDILLIINCQYERMDIRSFKGVRNLKKYKNSRFSSHFEKFKVI